MLRSFTKKKFQFSFTPHLSPMFRGILSTIYVDLENNITPVSIKKSIEEIIDSTAEQDHVTIPIDNVKQLVGKDLEIHIKELEKKMNTFASNLEFEDAATVRDEINRLKAKQMGLNKKALER